MVETGDCLEGRAESLGFVRLWARVCPMYLLIEASPEAGKVCPVARPKQMRTLRFKEAKRLDQGHTARNVRALSGSRPPTNNSVSRHQAVCGPDTAKARGSVTAGMKAPDFNSVNIRPLLTRTARAAPASTGSSPVQQQLPDYASRIPLRWQEGQAGGPSSPPQFKGWVQGLQHGQADSLP